MRKSLLGILFLCFVNAIWGQTALHQYKETAMNAILKQIQRFNYMYPQEKVYLHFDNTGYFRGETIWFKAYVVRTDKGGLSDMSKVLYVELVDPTGDVVETRKLHIDNGQCSGDIKLDKLLVGGFYEVRAYTRYMLNWDASCIFSRVLPIFNAPKKAGDYSKAVMPEFEYRKRLPNLRPKDSIVGQKDDYDVRFFPEGGRLVDGLQSRGAFDIVGKHGAEFGGKAWLEYASGERKEVEIVRECRGVFDYVPGEHPATFVLAADKDEYRFPLPESDPVGAVMAVHAISDDFIDVYVERSGGYDSPLGMLLINNGNVEAAEMLPDGKSKTGLRFKTAEMNGGVNQLALIDGNGRMVARRLVFVYPRGLTDTISITSPTLVISPCGKITLDAQTVPNATFSISVRDAASETNGRFTDIATWLLLSSELKGYIHRPEYYFERNDYEHRRAADLLMMVQGWARYDTDNMQAKRPAANQPLEDGLYLYGKIKTSKKNNPIDGLKLRASLYNPQGLSLSGKATTDTAGGYAFKLPDCDGEWNTLLDVENNKRIKDLGKYVVTINRNFSPLCRPLAAAELQRIPIERSCLPLAVSDSFDVEADFISAGGRVLREVNVKGHRRFANARARWENEKRGEWKASLKYDIDKAVEEIIDKGDEMPSLFEWLMTQNPFFNGAKGDLPENVLQDNSRDESSAYTITSDALRTSLKLYEDEEKNMEWTTADNTVYNDGITYKNRPVILILNNCYYAIYGAPNSVKGMDFKKGDRIVEPTVEELPTWLDEFKTVYISENNDVWQRYVFIDKLTTYYPVTVFIYTHHSFPVKQKGLRRTYFSGYSKASVFQHPDYSAMASMPDHRRTLYWNPDVKTDSDGRARVEFYNNSTCRQITVSAEGMTADGRAVTYK